MINTRKLIRTLARERNPMIVYDNKATEFKEIFKIHPLESKKNQSYFEKMDLTIEYWGNGSILMLRSGFTYDILQKISKNSLKDVVTFYELAKHTTLNFLKDKTDITHAWYKTSLTMLWLAHPEHNIDGLNYWKELSPQQKDNATRLAIEIYGANGYKNIETKNIETLNSLEKIIEVFLHSNIHLKEVITHKNNKIQEVVDYVFNQGVKIDYEKLTQLINLKKYNPYILAQLTKHPSKVFDITKINLPIDKLKQVNDLIIDSDKDFIPMQDFYDLVTIQSLFIKMKNFIITSGKAEPVKDFEFKSYTQLSEIIFLAHIGNEFVSKSFIKFFNTIKEKLLSNLEIKDKEKDFWLNATLEMELIEKPNKKISVKI